MLSLKIEQFLAQLYTDPKWLQQFLQNPTATLEKAGFTPAEIVACGDWDIQGIQMACASYQHKRDKKKKAGLLSLFK